MGLSGSRQMSDPSSTETERPRGSGMCAVSVPGVYVPPTTSHSDTRRFSHRFKILIKIVGQSQSRCGVGGVQSPQLRGPWSRTLLLTPPSGFHVLQPEARNDARARLKYLDGQYLCPTPYLSIKYCFKLFLVLKIVRNCLKK